jgi:hypothetical protein
MEAGVKDRYQREAVISDIVFLSFVNIFLFPFHI